MAPSDQNTPRASTETDHPQVNPTVNRRTALRAGSVTAVAIAALGVTNSAGKSTSIGGPNARAQSNVFRHGIASGDPMPDRVIVWTRLTPTSDAHPGSGLGPAVLVSWEIAADENFHSVIRTGSVRTDAGRDHTVKVDATGLPPHRWLFYRFTALGESSPVGRTKTAPDDSANPGRVRFGVVSCSNWEAGYFSAYRHLADHDDIDAVIHLGDYIYEYRTGEFAGKNGVVRPHFPPHEIVSLTDYRQRLAQYRTDPDLQRLHSRVPFICTWDDHEVANDSWANGAKNHQAYEGDFGQRRANSAQAYFEWMPVRPNSLRDGEHLYRRLRFGTLMELSMLDLRTYRDVQPNMLNGGAIDDARRSMTGPVQMQWLRRGLESSTTRWNIIGNSVMISPVLVPPLDTASTGAITTLLGLPSEGIPYNADQWDGYAAERRKLLGFLSDQGISNCVFLTGDIHSAWACDVPIAPANYPGGGTVATEFVVSSVTSKNIDDFVLLPEGNQLTAAVVGAFQATNHHIRFLDFDRHGFSVFEVTEDYAHMDWWSVTAKEDPRAGCYRLASWRKRHGGTSIEPAGPLP